MKRWLPRAALLQLSQQTNAKLKFNSLMGSRLSKQLLCARAALHLVVTAQPVPNTAFSPPGSCPPTSLLRARLCSSQHRAVLRGASRELEVKAARGETGALAAELEETITPVLGFWAAPCC